MKKIELVAECNNKTEMINRAIDFIKTQEGSNAIAEGNWSGSWDGMQWSARIVFINPQLAEKHNKAIQDEFAVRFAI